MTTPSKGWTRSFSPSFTFQCTRTVSPVRNSVRSFRICFDSMYSKRARRMAGVSVPERRWPYKSWAPLQLALLHGQQLPVLVREGEPGPQVGPPGAGELERVPAPPAGDAGVVPALEDRRDLGAAEGRRPGVVGVLQKPLLEALAPGGGLVPQHP